jgi:hypothetical protein
MMEDLPMDFAAVTVAGVSMGPAAVAAVSSFCRRAAASFSHCSVAAAMASSSFLRASASLDLVGIARTVGVQLRRVKLLGVKLLGVQIHWVDGVKVPGVQLRRTEVVPGLVSAGSTAFFVGVRDGNCLEYCGL